MERRTRPTSSKTPAAPCPGDLAGLHGRGGVSPNRTLNAASKRHSSAFVRQDARAAAARTREVLATLASGRTGVRANGSFTSRRRSSLIYIERRTLVGYFSNQPDECNNYFRQRWIRFRQTVKRSWRRYADAATRPAEVSESAAAPTAPPTSRQCSDARAASWPALAALWPKNTSTRPPTRYVDSARWRGSPPQ